ncbi:hypothetical protein, partial [Vibrio vulnificus]|uniref:hypothetical protein n=1 Tax=Vibrio vulnificus TaxID=672 RepID=UPI001CCE3036
IIVENGRVALQSSSAKLFKRSAIPLSPSLGGGGPIQHNLESCKIARAFSPVELALFFRLAKKDGQSWVRGGHENTNGVFSCGYVPLLALVGITFRFHGAFSFARSGQSIKGASFFMV